LLRKEEVSLVGPSLYEVEQEAEISIVSEVMIIGCKYPISFRAQDI